MITSLQAVAGGRKARSLFVAAIVGDTTLDELHS
jgi:hypothetical protein